MNELNQPRQHQVQCLHGRVLHRMVYWEWGDAGNPDVLLCAHGLTRQGRDFDSLARACAGDYRVVCPDLIALHEFAGAGHAPTLVQPEQIAVVREFLGAG